MRKTFLVELMVSAAVLGVATPALAQDTAEGAQAAAPTSAEEETDENDVIVVTGTAGGAGLRKQDASFAITTMTADNLAEAGLKSTAEVFTLVPGVWAESSGGKAGANIDVRGLPGGGDAPFVTFAIGGAPLYGTPSLSFFEQSTAFRVDETIGSVEALRGGPSSVFGRGEPGVTLNFRLKEGSEETSGRVKYTTSDYSLHQIDAVISGPLGGDLYYMVGGYWSTSPGIRDAEFQSEKGKQITGQLTWRGANGKVNVFTRWTDDVGQWYLPMSLISGNDLGTFSQLGNATRYRTLQIDAAGTTRRFDMANGRGWRGSLSGLNAEFDLSDNLTLRDNLAYLAGSADTYGFVPDGGAVLVSTLPGGTARTAGGTVLAGAEYVQNYGNWIVEKDLKSLSNDLSLALKTGGNEITVGFYHSAYSSKDFWTLGNFTPVHNVQNGDYLSAATSCADLVTAGSQSGCWNYDVDADGQAKVNALYIADSLEVTDKLRIDVGVRREWMNIKYTVDDGDIDGVTRLNYDNDFAAWAWTGAVNYAFTSDFGLFARYSSGFSLPNFDGLRDGQENIKKIKQLEGGVKYTGDWLRLYATVFRNTNDAFTGGVGSTLPPSAFSTKATGIELDSSLKFGVFNLAMIATYQDATVTKSSNASIVDNRIPRQPKFQFRLSPSVDLTFGDWEANIYGALAQVGPRFDGYQNAAILPKYTKVDAGFKLTSPFGVFATVQADNLLNSKGLTEGDGRSFATTNSRPIMGRSFRFSIGYDF